MVTLWLCYDTPMKWLHIVPLTHKHSSVGFGHHIAVAHCGLDFDEELISVNRPTRNVQKGMCSPSRVKIVYRNHSNHSPSSPAPTTDRVESNWSRYRGCTGFVRRNRPARRISQCRALRRTPVAAARQRWLWRSVWEFWVRPSAW